MFRTSMLVILLVCASGCQTFLIPEQKTPTSTIDPLLTDRSLLVDLPCAAPCWYGLQVGRSTRMDVLSTLQTLQFIDINSIQESATTYWDPLKDENLNAALIHADCIEPEGYQCVGLVLVNDILASIASFPHFPLTYAEVVDHLGIPDYVRVFPDLSGECEIDLIWMERQIIVSHSERSSNESCHEISTGAKINASFEVHRIYYHLANSAFLTSVPEPGMDFAWPGFDEP